MHDRDVGHPVSSLHQKLKSLYGLRSGGRINFDDNSAYLALLEGLDCPHLKLPPVIHVAGTNGKGSTIAMIRALLEASGCCVHVYTSPHLICFNERIVLAGSVVADDVLEQALDHVLELNQERSCTFFEITTALAFYLFSRYPADYCLLETGMGGRLDCTNIVPKPVLSVITPIGLDHQEFLGVDIPSIAREKAGIIKPEVPCVLARQNDEYAEVVREVVLARTVDLNSSLVQVSRIWDKKLELLRGSHQIDNFNTALCAISQLGIHLPVQALENVACTVKWRGRFERIVCPDLSSDYCLWFDGGHNEQAAKAMVKEVRDLCDVAMVVGLSGGRKPEDFLKYFVGSVESVYAVPIEGVGGVAVDEVVACANQLGFDFVKGCDSVREAVLSAMEESRNILVCGSLYLYEETLNLSV